MQQELSEFIVIDDDPINNLICKKIISLTIPKAGIQTFTNPENGLDHIRSVYDDHASSDAVLFLDINMPKLTGWDVLDKIHEYTETIKAHVKIYMLSSSVDLMDQERARQNPLVCGYITKPLSQHKLEAILPPVN